MNINGLKHCALGVLLTLVTCACSTQNAVNPQTREQELARNDVWHAAKLRGVAFRAVGQEPGWLLEITNGEAILLVEDKSARKTVFQTGPGTSVTIEGIPCNDSMSGESFQTTVTVTLDGKTYTGCGRALF